MLNPSHAFHSLKPGASYILIRLAKIIIPYKSNWLVKYETKM